ncbi:MAG: phage portal protein [Bryobacteraceae bacterium]|nr:phage portal protein [Bryobacteraceae bacterium]
MSGVKAYLFDSHAGRVVNLDAPLLLDARYESARWQHTLKAMQASDGSAQVPTDVGVSLDGVNCAVRPFDLTLFAYALVVNTYHARAVRAKAKDITGRPWRIAGEGPEGKRLEIERFFRKAFGKRSFAQGMGCVWTDYEAIGNGFLEIIPDRTGQPAELAHAPAPEIWVRLDGLGYVQHKQGRYAHFRDYFVEEEHYADLPEKDPLKAKWSGTFLTHFSRYSPWSPFYGVPAIMPAWNAVALWTLVAEYNLQFFNNNAIPDYAVVIEGEAAEDAVEVIQEYFRTHLKGQAHKTLVLEAPNGSKIRFEKLTSDSAREASFRLLRQDCRDELLHAHGVPPQKVGIVESGKLGGNLATEQIEEYKNSIVTPGQEMVVSVLSEIIERGFKVSDLWFEFEAWDLDDREANSRVDATYLDRGVLVPNEVRRERFPDLDPLSDGDLPLGGAAAFEAAIEEIQREVRKAVQL